MIDSDLIRHASEFKGYIDNHKYEVSNEGIEFPTGNVLVHGEYFDDYGVEPNLLPTEGLNHLLMVALSNTAKLNNFYLALFSGDYTPTAAIKASTFSATATEITSGAEGYSQATRPVWTPGSAVSGQIDNNATKAAFNIVTASSVTIRGAALLSDSVKGSGVGVLISIARFGQDRLEYNGNVYNLGYRVRLTST